MIRRPPESTRTDTPFPSTTLFRSVGRTYAANAIGAVAKAMKLDSLTTKFLGVLAENRRLADLPGMIDAFAAIVAGYEYRKYEGSYTPDPITIAGEYNGVPSGATSGDYDVNELYVEFNVQIGRVHV